MKNLAQRGLVKYLSLQRELVAELNVEPSYFVPHYVTMLSSIFS